MANAEQFEMLKEDAIRAYEDYIRSMREFCYTDLADINKSIRHLAEYNKCVMQHIAYRNCINTMQTAAKRSSAGYGHQDYLPEYSG